MQTAVIRAMFPGISGGLQSLSVTILNSTIDSGAKASTDSQGVTASEYRQTTSRCGPPQSRARGHALEIHDLVSALPHSLGTHCN